MRAWALPPVVLLSLVALAPPGGAHAPADCAPARFFPSSAGWILAPGDALTYLLPARQFGSVLTPGPLDVAVHALDTCAVDPACHHHDVSGLVACGTDRAVAFEVANRGDADVPVLLAIGQCGFGAVC